MSRAKAVERHLRKYLGEPSKQQQNVATFDDVPTGGAFTLVTVGFSEIQVRGERQELLVAAWKRFQDDSIADTLRGFAGLVMKNSVAVAPGAVFQLPRPISSQTLLDHFFVYPPTYFDDALESVGEVSVLWLIPITAAESDFIESNGAEAFEQLLLDRDPDLLDLNRASLV